MELTFLVNFNSKKIQKMCLSWLGLDLKFYCGSTRYGGQYNETISPFRDKKKTGIKAADVGDAIVPVRDV